MQLHKELHTNAHLSIIHYNPKQKQLQSITQRMQCAVSVQLGTIPQWKKTKYWYLLLERWS